MYTIATLQNAGCGFAIYQQTGSVPAALFNSSCMADVVAYQLLPQKLLSFQTAPAERIPSRKGKCHRRVSGATRALCWPGKRWQCGGSEHHRLLPLRMEQILPLHIAAMMNWAHARLLLGKRAPRS